MFGVAGFQETLGGAKSAELASLCVAEGVPHLLELRVGYSDSAHGFLIRDGTLDQSPDVLEMV